MIEDDATLETYFFFIGLIYVSKIFTESFQELIGMFGL